jgi:hypothetical protein
MSETPHESDPQAPSIGKIQCVALREVWKHERSSSRDRVRSALDWDRVDGRKRCLIRVTVPVGGYRDGEDRWPDHPAARDRRVAVIGTDALSRIQALRI